MSQLVPSSLSLVTRSAVIPLFALLLIPGVGLFVPSYVFAEDAMSGPSNVSAMELETVGKIDVSRSPPIEGLDDAPVTIIEFGDFQCPKCDQWFLNEKPTIKNEYIETGKANLYFVDFTFLGNDSMTAANAAYCAGEQGKYWEFHSHLYNNQGEINGGWASSTNLKMFASDVDLDVVVFDECLDSGKYDDRVAYNTSVGTSNDVEGTPTFFIVDNFDGTIERIDGPQPSDVFAGVIDAMLEGSVPFASATGVETVPETENQADQMTSDNEEMLSDTADKITDMATDATEQTQEIVSEDESHVEQIVDEVEPMVDERPKVNVGVDDNAKGGGCLIATAAYGTELAPQVQFLREIRDNQLMNTQSGTAFMSGFNQLYYLFSPTIADMEREHPLFQEAVRVFITPMISTLSIMTLANDDSEAKVLGLGISVVLLNLGMYVAVPVSIGFKIHKHIQSGK